MAASTTSLPPVAQAPDRDPLRVAVVGCGALAHATHLPTIAASSAMVLQAVCDRDPAMAASAAGRFAAARTCHDWQELAAAPDIDLIVLCTHTNLRSQLILPALAAGKPVYTEKPAAADETEMLAIIRAAEAARVPVCVGHNRRSAPAMRRFLELAARARRQGADVPAIIDRCSALRRPLREEGCAQLLIRINDDSRTSKGWECLDPQGVMVYEMVHFVDLALLLAGSPPVRVYASGSNRGNFTQIIDFQDGGAATIQQSVVGNFDAPKELFEYTAGHVTVALDHFMEVRQRGLGAEPFRTTYPLGLGAEVEGGEGIEAFHRGSERLQQLRRAGAALPCLHVFPDKGHRQHLEAFAAHVRGAGPNPCPVADSFAVTRVTMRLLQSARLGQPLPVLPEDTDPVQGDIAALLKGGL